MHVVLLSGIDGLTGERQVCNVLRADAQSLGSLFLQLSFACADGQTEIGYLQHLT